MSDRSQNLRMAGLASLRVDGIDLAQLLRDLGEASAASSAVDLFGLCLNAQRVLTQIHPVAVAGGLMPGVANTAAAGI